MRGMPLSGVVRSVAGLAGLVLFSLPASAQSRFLSEASASWVSQPALSAVIPAQPVVHRLSLAEKSPRLLAEGAPLTVAPSTAGGQTLTLRMAGSFEEVRTPFLNQVRVPLVSIGSGRLQLSGFRSVTPMENLMWGLPLRASASGSSVVQQCHPGIRVPRNNQSYGLSLRFRFSKQDADRAGNGLWHAANQAASWGRAFFTL